MQAILLAAGRGQRYGAAGKLMQPLADGTPMAVAAARNLKAALPDCLAVVNSEDAALIALLEQTGFTVTICPNADQGMGASLAWGVARTRTASGWLIALADMPWIAPQTIRGVAAKVTGPRVIAAPLHQDRRGHPVAFGHAYGRKLMKLAGDEGARHILAAHARHVVLLPAPDPGVLRDVDVREQLGQ
jgi:molybdenum cofactor cytidylyltransferase